ncbi:MAG: phenylacetate--CoA ligase family protein [Limisphaerales bacterium]|jgi:phenylacetate-CoA ligase|nr:phenylacetate--CoA ligase [Verrucomicrobiota bacterium]
MFWEKDIETASRQTLSQLQFSRLRETVTQLAEKSEFYQNKFRELGVTVDSIRSLDDVRRLPFTTSADLRAQYPDKLNIVDKDHLLRLHTSSGTTGKPKALFFSRKDIDTLTNNFARCLTMVGCTPRDVFQNMMTYGLFTGAMMSHYGAEKIGMLAIPAGPGNSERQLMLMQDFGTTVAHATPSYALYFANFIEKKGMDPAKDIALRIFLVGAESYTEETRRKIEKTFEADVFNCYGLSEMGGPGVGFECTAKKGIHLWEDTYLIEIIDPETLEVLPPGEVGELVITSIQREAMPILRYRTGDLTSIIPEPCPCGRTHIRVDRLKGRADDMIIVKGANVYPQQIERILMETEGVGRNYLIHLQGLDEMIVKVELDANAFDGRISMLEGMQKNITDRIRAEVQVKPVVELLAPGTLPVSEGKTKRVIDNRSL